MSINETVLDIFWDQYLVMVLFAGMVDEITGDLRTGLVDLILGIYEYDPVNKDTTKDVLRAAEKMGILDPNADMVPIEKICRFFLKDFADTQVCC